MALRDIKPTRSELITLKRKIQLSERGYKILKMKRDGLILEFFKVLAEQRTATVTFWKNTVMQLR
jgi:V/A-type H+-transporting ATPase subunit D